MGDFLEILFGLLVIGVFVFLIYINGKIQEEREEGHFEIEDSSKLKAKASIVSIESHKVGHKLDSRFQTIVKFDDTSSFRTEKTNKQVIISGVKISVDNPLRAEIISDAYKAHDAYAEKFWSEYPEKRPPDAFTKKTSIVQTFTYFDGFKRCNKCNAKVDMNMNYCPMCGNGINNLFKK